MSQPKISSKKNFFRKLIFAFANQFLLLFLFFSYNAANAQLRYYRQLPASEIPLSPHFKVEIKQGSSSYQEIFTYQIIPNSNGHVTKNDQFANFGFNPSGGPVSIRVTRKDGVALTASNSRLKNKTLHDVTQTHSGGALILTCNSAKKHLYVSVDGKTEYPLMIFADPYANRPYPSNAKVVKFAARNTPYVQTAQYDRYTIPNDVDVVEIEDGAIVKGTIHTNSNRTKPLLLTGRGVILGNGDVLHGSANIPYNALVITKGDNHIVENIMVINSRHFTIDVGNGAVLDNAKMYGYDANNDGIVGKEGCIIQNVFSKVNDDHIKLYNDNMVVRNCNFWVQQNGALFQLAWNSIVPGSNCLVEDCEVLAWEAKCGDPRLNQGGVARTFINLREYEATNAPVSKNNTFRNIHVQGQLDRFIGINAKYQGSKSISLENYVLENITIDKMPARYSWMYTGGNSKLDFSFKNVRIEGKCLSQSNYEFINEGNVVLDYLGCGTNPVHKDPVISFTSPTQNANISGNYTVKVNAYDEDFGITHGSGITSVLYQIYDINDPSTSLFSETVTAAPFELNLDTKKFPDGQYEFRAGVQSQDFTTGRKWTVLKPVSIKNATTLPAKPNIWIHTDITGALSYTVNGNIAEAVTDASSDPDDQVAMAMYLMMANKFNTKGIVLASTTRNTTYNTLSLFSQTLGAAYQKDLPCLNQNIGGYPTLDGLNVKESSLTAGIGFLSYSESPVDKYDNFADLPQTVKDLVLELGKSEYSAQNPLYVLIWGPMTEIAMTVRHLIRNNKTAELERLFVVSHWTSSFLSQTGTPCSSFPADQIQFKPANCNQNCEACAYMHNEAKKNGAKFRFVDLGSVGQSGIVNGSGTYFTGGNGGVNGPQYLAFQESALGDLFVRSKFGFGKPDGSDCATFITVLGDYGVKLSDFNNNGILSQNHETLARDKYLQTAQTLMQNLMNISKQAKSCVINTPKYIQTFTYPIAAGQAIASDKYDVYVKVGNGPEQKLQVLMSDVNYRTMYDGDWMKAENKDRTFSFVHLDYDATGPQLTFRVVKKFGTNSSSAIISPKSYAYTPTLTSGKELTFKVNSNNKYISVNFKGTDNESPSKGWIKNMLCIFVDQPETGKPVTGSAGVVKYSNNAAASALGNASVIYFPAGYHNLRNYANGGMIDADGALTLKSGQSIYLEGGAFVEGIIKRTAYGDVNQKITGRGILTGRQYYWKNHPSFSGTEYGQLIELGNNAEVKGIMYMESPNHGVVGRSVHVENVKFLGWHSNHDGVRVGDGSEIHNSFFRAVDDHFYNFGIYVHDCVLWAGHNGSILTYGWGGGGK